MKTITTLIIAAATSFSLSANADVNNTINDNLFLNDTIDEEYSYINATSDQNMTRVLSVDNHSSNQLSFLNNNLDEEYRHTDNSAEQNIASILTAIEQNPTAAGGRSRNESTFLKGAVDEEHHH